MMLRLAARVANRSRDLLFAPAFDTLWRRRVRGKVACLLYHRVALTGDEPFLDAAAGAPITPGELAAELGFLRQQGARFITLADMREGRWPAADEFAVAVTFDDGFADTYRTGLPLIEQLGLRATVFQATGLVDASELVWEHALYWHWHRRRGELLASARRRWPAIPLGERPALDWLRSTPRAPDMEQWLRETTEASGDARAMADAAARLYPAAADLRSAREHGHEIGSHGDRHYPRSMLDADAFERELVNSAQRLVALTGLRPHAFSYPFGSYQPADGDACARHFEQAFTVDAAHADASAPPFAIPRLTWQGPFRSALRRRRWLWTGRV